MLRIYNDSAAYSVLKSTIISESLLEKLQKRLFIFKSCFGWLFTAISTGLSGFTILASGREMTIILGSEWTESCRCQATGCRADKGPQCHERPVAADTSP